MAPGRKSPASVYLSRWPDDSDTYVTLRGALDRVARLLGAESAEAYPWEEVDYATARAIPAKLAKAGLKPSTINKVLSAVRGVLEVCKELGLTEAVPEIKPVRGVAERAGRALSADEKDEVEDRLHRLPARDAAVVALLVGAGARRVELVRAQRGDYDPSRGRITLYGKGNKAREVPVGRRWRPFLEAWCDQAPDGPLFDLTRRQVSYIIEQLCAGMKKFTPHDLRRTFGTHVCESADPTVAQRLLGHSDIKTTLLYDRRGEEAEDKAVEDL